MERLPRNITREEINLIGENKRLQEKINQLEKEKEYNEFFSTVRPLNGTGIKFSYDYDYEDDSCMQHVFIYRVNGEFIAPFLKMWYQLGAEVPPIEWIKNINPKMLYLIEVDKDTSDTDGYFDGRFDYGTSTHIHNLYRLRHQNHHHERG